METVPWPFKDSEFFVVIAERSLEHVIHLDRVVFEVARILESGGHFRVRVPYGLRSLYDPFHHRAFNKSSFRRFTTEDSDLHSAPLFTVKRIAYDHAYPLKWHLATHLGIKNLPIGPRAHILFDLVRTAWRSETWHKP
jgi:SAM-dependent methyltransferase